MIYLRKDFKEFITEGLNEAAHAIKSTPIDYAKINCLRQQMNSLKKRLTTEQDSNQKRRLQMQIKICDLKIMVAYVK